MAVCKGDKVAYHTSSGEMRTGTVVRKTGQGMVDIRLDGSNRLVRQAGSSLSRLRTNGRHSRRRGRRNPAGAQGGGPEERWILPFAGLIESGTRTGVLSVDAVLDQYAGRVDPRQEFGKLVAQLKGEEERIFAAIAAADPDFLAHGDLSERAALFQNLRGHLPATSHRTEGIFTSRFQGEQARVDIATGRSGARTAEAQRQFRTEQRREKRYVEAQALTAARKKTQGQDIFQEIQERGAAVRILPDPVRTDRAETFICGNVIDGHAYTLNTTAKPRMVSHWLTYGDLGLEMRNGKLAFDSKKATYRVRVGKKSEPLTLENILSIDINKAQIMPAAGGQGVRTFVQKVGGEDSLRPFEVVPLAAGGDLNPVLSRARNEGSPKDVASPQNVEALKAFIAGLKDNALLKDKLSSGYAPSEATLVGITNVGAQWIKSKGSKSGVYDPKSGALRSSKTQGGSSAGLYPRAATPSELPAVRIQGAGFSVPDNRIRPETPILFSVPRKEVSGDEGQAYALDMDRANIFRDSELLAIRTTKNKDATRQTLRDYFQIFAPNSPKDRNPYYSWVPERPGQFPDVSVKESDKQVNVFERYCPEPKQLEYLEAVRQTAYAVSNVMAAAHAVRGDMNSMADVGPSQSPNFVQASTIYYAGNGGKTFQVVKRAEDYFSKKVTSLRFALARLSVEYDRINEAKAIRPYRGQPAADYAIFDKVDALDFLLPSEEAKDFVHAALDRLKKTIKALIEDAVKNGVLVEETRVSGGRVKKAKDRKKYKIRTFERGFTPYPAGSVVSYIEYMGRKNGWSSGVVADLAQSLSKVTSWTQSSPNVVRALEERFPPAGLTNGKEFFADLRARTLPSYAKSLERIFLSVLDVDGEGHLRISRKKATSYAQLYAAMLGLSAYRPDDLGDLALRATVSKTYQISFEQIVRALAQFSGRGETVDFIDAGLAGYPTIEARPGSDTADKQEFLSECLQLGKQAILGAFSTEAPFRETCVNLLDYLHQRAVQNLSLPAWRGGSNFVFAEAMAIYLSLKLDQPTLVGPFTKENAYIGGVQDVPALLSRLMLQKTVEDPKAFTLDKARVITQAYEKIQEEAYKQGREVERLDTLNDAEFSALVTVMNRTGLANEAAEVVKIREAVLTQQADKTVDVARSDLRDVARQLRETLKIAIAGGHGIEDASRIRTAGQRPVRINGYYTYNPLLFTLTRDQYRVVTGREFEGKLPFPGFFRYDKKSGQSVWRNQQLAESIDKIGFYGMLIYWARTAALQYEKPIQSERDLQEAWNVYWDRVVEDTGEDAFFIYGNGKKPLDAAGRGVDLPVQFYEFAPRAYQTPPEDKKVTIAAHVYAVSRKDLFGIIREVKGALYETHALRAATLSEEGFYPPGSEKGVGGRESQVIVRRGDGWKDKLGVALYTMRPVLAARILERPSVEQRAASQFLQKGYQRWQSEQGVRFSTDSNEYIATMARTAALVLGVPGLESLRADNLGSVAPEKLGPLVEALYAARTEASKPPIDARLSSWQVTATDKPQFEETHLNVAHKRVEFKKRLLDIIDRKIQQLSS